MEQRETRSAFRRAAVGCGLAALLAGMTGCTFVAKQEGADAVQVVERARVAGCERLAETKVSVLSKVGFVDRSTRKVERELATLARNEAAEKGGNFVVANGPPENGRQSYDIYRCASD